MSRRPNIFSQEEFQASLRRQGCAESFISLLLPSFIGAIDACSQSSSHLSDPNLSHTLFALRRTRVLPAMHLW